MSAHLPFQNTNPTATSSSLIIIIIIISKVPIHVMLFYFCVFFGCTRVAIRVAHISKPDRGAFVLLTFSKPQSGEFYSVQRSVYFVPFIKRFAFDFLFFLLGRYQKPSFLFFSSVDFLHLSSPFSKVFQFLNFTSVCFL